MLGNEHVRFGGRRRGNPSRKAEPGASPPTLWSKTTPPLAIQIELHDYGWALLRALHGALEFADEEVGDHIGTDVEHLDQVPNTVVKRVGTLWHFTAEAQARIDALAVQDGLVPPIAA